MAMSSHANPRNPYVKRLLTRKQLRAEFEDHEYSTGHKKRDSLQSYLNIRTDIVRECGDGKLNVGAAYRERAHYPRYYSIMAVAAKE